MYELIQLSEHDFYIDCPTKIGVVLTGENEAVLIDSGNDKDAGKKILRVLQGRGWTLKAIFNTHSHADHIGGNRLLQDRTACRIYAAGLECVFSNSPVLEPISLFGGLPFHELQNKFLQAQESKVEPITPQVLPEGMQLLALPGHSFEMCGFLTKDGTAFIGDAVIARETLEKYGIGFMWDPAAELRTLEELPKINAARFVPSHAEVTEDIAELAECNAASIRKTQEKILEFCKKPLVFEALLKKLFDEFGLPMTPQQYALVGSTIRSYLSWLYAAGQVTMACVDNELRWTSAG